jgi:hypothetical protein
MASSWAAAASMRPSALASGALTFHERSTTVPMADRLPAGQARVLVERGYDWQDAHTAQLDRFGVAHYRDESQKCTVCVRDVSSGDDASDVPFRLASCTPHRAIGSSRCRPLPSVSLLVPSSTLRFMAPPGSMSSPRRRASSTSPMSLTSSVTGDLASPTNPTRRAASPLSSRTCAASYRSSTSFRPTLARPAPSSA